MEWIPSYLSELMPMSFAARLLGLRSGLLLFAVSVAAAQTPAPQYTQADVQQLLKTKCAACHWRQGSGGRIRRCEAHASRQSARSPRPVEKGRLTRPEWRNAAAGAAWRSRTERRLPAWVQSNLHAEACAAGVVPGPAPVRRLSRSQYTSTIRDLLNVHVDIGATLPADGAGGEGFDNAAETLFLSPIHAEKYLEAAKARARLCRRRIRGRARSS